ncbi:MAG TPA: hypothetical protein VFP65_07725 [Anaeromyxobacteraceae bacterium]|nr:hypothetical protein [Anaeromyxobacteraceae bacterium]
MPTSSKQFGEWKVLAEAVLDTVRAGAGVAASDVVELCNAIPAVLAELESAEELLAAIEDAQSRDRASCVVCGRGPKHEPQCRLATFMRDRQPLDPRQD